MWGAFIASLGPQIRAILYREDNINMRTGKVRTREEIIEDKRQCELILWQLRSFKKDGSIEIVSQCKHTMEENYY